MIVRDFGQQGLIVTHNADAFEYYDVCIDVCNGLSNFKQTRLLLLQLINITSIPGPSPAKNTTPLLELHLQSFLKI